MYTVETSSLTKRFKRLRGYRDLVLYPWRRRDVVALRDVSLRIHSGALFGILGQNGAGKTTLIRILCTTLLPSSGTACVAGIDVLRQPERVRRRIGLVQVEERSFYWRLTGRQNLEFFAALYHLPTPVARDRIQSLMRRLHVDSEADRPFQSLSTGTRQKFAIIRGLMTEPEVLFLDEPTRSLDPIATHDVRSFLKDHVVRELGTTVVLATHSLEEAEELCTGLVLLREGQIAAEGTPAALRESFGGGLVCEFTLANAPLTLGEQLRGIAGATNITQSVTSDGVRLAIMTDRRDGQLNDLLRVVLDSGADVRKFSSREPTLEEVYVRVLGAPADRDGNMTEHDAK